MAELPVSAMGMVVEGLKQSPVMVDLVQWKPVGQLL